MKKLLLVLIFFVLNTMGSFGEPSSWETLKWINENVEKYSKGFEEIDTWNGNSKLAYKDDVKYDENAIYITRKWQQAWYSAGETQLVEGLDETYRIPLKRIAGVSIGKDGKSIMIVSKSTNILHTGEYFVKRNIDGALKTEKDRFSMNLEKAELFTVNDERILKGLENAFLHLVKSSDDSTGSLDNFFISSTDYYELGMEKMKEGDYQNAAENFIAAISLEQNVKDSHYNLGRSYYELGNYQKAVSEFKSVLEIEPDSQNSHYYLGIVYYAIEDYEGASRELETAVNLDSSDSQAYYSLGMVDYMKNDYNRAVADFTRAMSLDESLKKAYYYRGISYYFQYKYSEALKDINMYIESNADDANAYYYKGLIHYISLEDEEAIEDFTKVLEIDPEYQMAYYYRGYLYYDNGKIEAAKKDYENLFKLAPDDKFTKKLGKLLALMK